MLDVGCGSGILAIAAAKLGAAPGLGVDTDPIAIEATLANAARNGLAGAITAREGSLPSGERPFDVVLANLIAPRPDRARAAPPRRAPARRRRSLASGIFVDREAEVRAAFEAVGLDVGGRIVEGEWVALEAVRR